MEKTNNRLAWLSRILIQIYFKNKKRQYFSPGILLDFIYFFIKSYNVLDYGEQILLQWGLIGCLVCFLAMVPSVNAKLDHPSVTSVNAKLDQVSHVINF